MNSIDEVAEMLEGLDNTPRRFKVTGRINGVVDFRRSYGGSDGYQGIVDDLNAFFDSVKHYDAELRHSSGGERRQWTHRGGCTDDVYIRLRVTLPFANNPESQTKFVLQFDIDYTIHRPDFLVVPEMCM
tara:strand:- start:225 stop:611 length:387 start_codon:yes stop_codon:yes gene_type:complete